MALVTSNMSESLYMTVADAARTLGISKTTLDWWDKSGFIPPSFKAPTSGKRTVRLYRFPDLVALKVANRLRAAGVSLQALRRIVHYLQEKDGIDSPLAVKMLVAIGNDVYEIRSDSDLVSVLRQPGQGAFRYVVDIEEAVQEVRHDIQELQAA